MSLTVKHKGYEISFSEISELWSCDDLNLTGERLSAIKSGIDKASSAERKVDKKALMISRPIWGSGDITVHEVKVTIVCEPRYADKDPTECWITDHKGSRSKVDIRDLIPPEELPAVEAWEKLHIAANHAVGADRSALAAIPRFTARTLKK